MGSASREALATASQTIHDRLEAAVPAELLSISAALADQPALANALSEATAEPESKRQLVARVFSDLSAGARGVIDAAVSERWSNTEEFVAGVEELAVKAAAAQAANLDEELLAVAELVDSDHDLELMLGSKLGEATAKAQVLRKLLAGKVSDDTLRIAEQIVSHPRGRRLSVALRQAARTAADQAGKLLALVTVAAPLDALRQDRLQKALSRNAGRPVKISTVVDPEVVGGIRVQIADEVIDGSVRRRLDDLRLQLAN